MLAALALTAPLSAQEISAPEPRWQTFNPTAMADAPTLLAADQTQGSSAAPDQPATMDSGAEQGKSAGEANTSSQEPHRPPTPFGCAHFEVVEDTPNVPPLTTHQKFRIFYRQTYDPCRFLGAAVAAGISQAEDHLSGYGQGAQGYGKRFGADLADANLATFFARSLLPSLLHDDPRYFHIGKSGTFKRRLVHAVFSPEWTRRDNGTHRFNYSRVLGDLMAVSVANAYYPDTDRGAGKTFEHGASLIGTGSAYAVFQEFWPDIRAKLPGKKHKPDK
jgi:hypothetical protein